MFHFCHVIILVSTLSRGKWKHLWCTKWALLMLAKALELKKRPEWETWQLCCGLWRFNRNGILTFVSSTSNCHVCLYFAIILAFTVRGLVYVVCLFVFIKKREWQIMNRQFNKATCNNLQAREEESNKNSLFTSIVFVILVWCRCCFYERHDSVHRKKNNTKTCWIQKCNLNIAAMRKCNIVARPTRTVEYVP